MTLDIEPQVGNTVVAATYRTIYKAEAKFALDVVAGTYMVLGSTTMVVSGTNLGTSNFLPMFRYEAGDYAITGLTTRLRVRFQIATNATQPTITFTAGLYPVTVAGGADTIATTLGTVVTGSTGLISSPAASTISEVDSGDFPPPADGQYAFGIVTGNTLTNNSAAMVGLQLQVRNT